MVGHDPAVGVDGVGEALLDVEASVEFALTSANGIPQMFIRVQPGTVATSGEYDGYNVWFPSSNTTANIGRQRGTSSSTVLRQISVSPGLSVGNRNCGY